MTVKLPIWELIVHEQNWDFKLLKRQKSIGNVEHDEEKPYHSTMRATFDATT
ncbi:protein of unknown function [Candidatus Nitrotoga arctica]|uniref:Uncharacterized protein n=1 Tax=Candidatus Nitrotoga arctica TaxID=453162 RepID=A0ABM8YYV2_9PROT|nr:protein of unknown function [Candidatus Nitrotoga arctica]